MNPLVEDFLALVRLRPAFSGEHFLIIDLDADNWLQVWKESGTVHLYQPNRPVKRTFKLPSEALMKLVRACKRRRRRATLPTP
jgi:hypothetical protein